MTTVNHRRSVAPRETKAPLVNRLLNGTMYLAALTASWTTVAVGGNNIVDYLLILALGVLIAARFNKTRSIFVSGWMLLPLVASLIITCWAIVVGSADSPDSTMQLRIFLSTAAVAVLLTSLAADGGSRELQRVLRLWSLGIAISAAVAILTSFGILHPSEVFVQKSGSRLSGLTSHPNALAFSLVMGIAPIMYLAGVARSWIRSLGWILAMIVVVWGLVLTGSRAGLIVGLPVLAIAVVLWLRSTRLRVVLVPLTILVGVALAFTIPALLADTRLGQGAEDSDAGRILINEAAMRWFYDSPVFGGGYDVMHGVAVPIMVLSGGGIILAIGYYAFLLRPVPVLLAGRALPIAQMGLLSLLAFLAFGVLNPVWMERITYWPALIAALVILLRGREGIRTNPWSKGDRSHNPVKR